MAMGRRKAKQRSLFVEAERMPAGPRHRFYDALNGLLGEAGFDEHVEDLCAFAYEAQSKGGRPSIPPGVYFRMLLIGYFEGIESERGICWRCEDSLSLKRFLGYEAHEATPDHSTLSRTRSRLPERTYEEVFRFVMRILNEEGLTQGRVAGVDATYLRADASMKTIVRKGSGEGYKGYLRKLAKEVGIEQPSDEELRRFDKKRKGKKTSNKEWESPTDPDAEIVRLKDGRTRFGYKAEHVVDMESGALLSVDVMAATTSDAESMEHSLELAEENLKRARAGEADDSDDDDSDDDDLVGGRQIKEVVADKGYHKAKTIRSLTDKRVRTYIPERIQHGKRRWERHGGRRTAQAVYANRARVKRAKSKALQRRRGELIERSFAHMCETGQHRRVRLRGEVNVRKRYLIHGAGFNLGLLMRSLFGVGTPRGAASRLEALLGPIRTLIAWVLSHTASAHSVCHGPPWLPYPGLLADLTPAEAGSSTGC
ncbi:transposase [Cognatishimia sp.]|uniref:transposase n=1 Tax=Cognatishimia sp. TaxID=2211648 RepID=UPI0035127D1B|nr:transposase [Cognatishimia sp.]